jgi:hypothetical protein
MLSSGAESYQGDCAETSVEKEFKEWQEFRKTLAQDLRAP